MGHPSNLTNPQWKGENPMDLIRAEKATMDFGGVRAVDNVDFAIRPEQIVGIIGPNGSGKTTIINALCYALYNKPFDNISLQKLINSTNATKNTQMEVRLIFEKDGIEYEI